MQGPPIARCTHRRSRCSNASNSLAKRLQPTPATAVISLRKNDDEREFRELQKTTPWAFQNFGTDDQQDAPMTAFGEVIPSTHSLMQGLSDQQGTLTSAGGRQYNTGLYNKYLSQNHLAQPSIRCPTRLCRRVSAQRQTQLDRDSRTHSNGKCLEHLSILNNGREVVVREVASSNSMLHSPMAQRLIQIPAIQQMSPMVELIQTREQAHPAEH